MEAYEEKDVKRDSFEEVDRILAIVEESKKKSDREDTISNLILTGFYLVMASVLGATMLFLFYEKSSTRMGGVFAPILILFLWAIFQTASINRTKRRVKREFEQTRDQATEIIREIVPVLAHSERWSALRKFELRLRLSKLGISTGQMFGHEFDLP